MVATPAMLQIEFPADLPVLQFPEDYPLTDELLLQISALNDAWRFERTADGALVILSPEGGECSQIELELCMQASRWWHTHRDGSVYSPSVGISHPDGRVMMPDSSWISAGRLGKRTRAERQGLVKAAPEFVAEVRSPWEKLEDQQQRLEDWIAYGVSLGILVDPDDRLVFVYRPGREPERYERPAELSAEPELPGFTIDFEKIWAVIGEDD